MPKSLNGLAKLPLSTIVGLHGDQRLKPSPNPLNINIRTIHTINEIKTATRDLGRNIFVFQRFFFNVDNSIHDPKRFQNTVETNYLLVIFV